MTIEQQSNQVRTLNKDKRAFIEAVEQIHIEEIPAEFDELATLQLAENLERTKLFLLGEIHGVKENPDIIYTLYKKFGFRNIALEWHPKLRVTAEQFLKTGNIDFAAIQDSPDGRITAGHFGLLKRLRNEGLLRRLICFDAGGKSWNERDAQMAQCILGSLADDTTLVVAGGLHTKTQPFELPEEPAHAHPMGESIKNRIADVASGKIEYLSGTYHNYGVQHFDGIGGQVMSTTARFYKSPGNLYVFEVPEAHAATVPNPSEKLPRSDL